MGEPGPDRPLERTKVRVMAKPDNAPPMVEVWVPGPWADRTAFMHALAQGTGGGFQADGETLVDTATKTGAPFEFLPAQRELPTWMANGSGAAFSDAETAAIANHRALVVLEIAADQPDLAGRLLRLTGAVKRAGGFGVRLGRCGLAHPWARWEEWLGNDGAEGLHRALIAQVVDAERGWVSSFGMNQLGLPDTAYDGDDFEADMANTLVFVFNMFQHHERPKLADGHTFSLDETAPVMQLAHEADDRFATSDPYFNPHGLWVLSPAEA